MFDAYTRPSKTKAIAFFLFNKSKLVDLSVKHDTAWILATSPDLYKRYKQGSYRPDPIELRRNAERRTVALRKSLLAAGAVVLIAAVLGTAVGITIGIGFGFLPIGFGVLQFAGAALLFWATIWELGWAERSFAGESLPERIHNWIFRTLYAIGTFLFFLAYTWASVATN